MRFLRWFWDSFWTVFSVIGIAWTPDDIGNWAGFLSGMAHQIDSPLIGFLSVILLTLLSLNFIERFKKWNDNIPGINTPRYLNWYKFPLRKIKWNFDNCVSMKTKGGKGPIITQFNAGIMVNWGNGIKPKKAFIRSLNKGVELELMIETDPNYKPAPEVTLIPKADRFFTIKGVFDPSLDEVDFLREYSGLDFVFEYDNKSFKKRFTRDELKLMVVRCQRFANPSAPLNPY